MPSESVSLVVLVLSKPTGDVDGCTQTNMAADAGADAQADGNAGCADCTCAE